ncbi:MAG: MFS transporter [Thermomicrobiales bacterium]
MIQFLLPLALGLAHGLADGSVGMQLGTLPAGMALERVGLLVLLYNVLAFGGQPLVGLIVDRVRSPRAAVLAGLLLHCAALIVSLRWPEGAVVLAGFGSAAFHVGGGALALCATRGRALGPGLFAAPGVAGLAIGGGLAALGHRPLLVFLLPLVVFTGVVWTARLPATPYTGRAEEPIFERHDAIMLVLLAGIALRSAVWNTVQYLLAGRVDVLIALGCAAAVGKVVGGALADRIGWRRWTVGALACAAPLLALDGERLVTLLPGVALLQSTVPVAMAAAGQLLPRRPALAAGLVLGGAIAAGALPAFLGVDWRFSAPAALAGVTLVALGALWWGVRQRGKPAIAALPAD